MDKNTLRAATLGANVSFKREPVEINGVKFELVQPTMQQRGEFRAAAMKFVTKTKEDGKAEDAKMDFDIYEFQMQAVIGLTVVPGTDERVFSAADREEISKLPAGGWFDSLAKVASELCNVTADTVKKD